MIKTLKEYIESVEGTRVGEEWFRDSAFKAYKKPDRKEPFEVAKDNGVLDTLEGPVQYSAVTI